MNVCYRCQRGLGTGDDLSGLCLPCKLEASKPFPCNSCSKLQIRIKELESLLAKEEHARRQANFAVVLLQERLKVFEEFCKEES